MIIGETVYAQGENTAEQEMAEISVQEKEEIPQISEGTQKSEKAYETGTEVLQSNEETQTQGLAPSRTGSVEIDETNFPDANFRSYISEQFDIDKDGNLSENERGLDTHMDICYNNISVLTGIEYFPMLSVLSCRGNQLTSLDVSKNLHLQILDCGENPLTNLNLGENTVLNSLECCTS